MSATKDGDAIRQRTEGALDVGLGLGENDGSAVDGNNVGLAELNDNLDGRVGDLLGREVGQGAGETSEGRLEQVVGLFSIAVGLRGVSEHC